MNCIPINMIFLSLVNFLGKPWCFMQQSKNNLAQPSAVNVQMIAIKWNIFKNLSVITLIISWFESLVGKLIAQSIVTYAHPPWGIGGGEKALMYSFFDKLHNVYNY